MTRYRIDGRDASLGIFEGDSPEQALEMLAKQAGAEALEPDLTVTELIHWTTLKVWHVDTELLASPEETRATLARYRAGLDTGRFVLVDPKGYPDAVSIYNEPSASEIDWEGFETCQDS